MSLQLRHPTDRPNFTEVSVNGLTLWFSYQTVIAYQTTGNIQVCENVWSKTTGKHLNYLCDKSQRLPYETFQQGLKDTLTAYGL